jgi:hypothetical protein
MQLASFNVTQLDVVLVVGGKVGCRSRLPGWVVLGTLIWQHGTPPG